MQDFIQGTREVEILDDSEEPEVRKSSYSKKMPISDILQPVKPVKIKSEKSIFISFFKSLVSGKKYLKHLAL